MPRKHDVKSIHLQIENFVPFVNENHIGFIIEWSSDIGYGEYTVYKSENDNNWYGDSECMDSNDDREFITELMRLFIEKINN